MQHSLAICAVAALLAAASATPGSAQAVREPIGRGSQLVAQAATQLEQKPLLQVRFRQRVELFGQQISGSGVYLQKASPRGLLLRLELKLPLADHLSTLQQVSDGRFLWVRRDTANGTSLSRVDLQRVAEAAAKSGGQTAVDPSTPWMLSGGLPGLLRGLAGNFDFEQVEPAELEGNPVWVTLGGWKTQKLAELLPAQQAAILQGKPADLRALPAHLPTEVRLVLGQRDLLPRQIAYHRENRADSASRPIALPTNQQLPFLVLEFFEISYPAQLEDSLFLYQPGNQEVVDHTDIFLRRLKRPADGQAEQAP